MYETPVIAVITPKWDRDDTTLALLAGLVTFLAVIATIGTVLAWPAYPYTDTAGRAAAWVFSGLALASAIGAGFLLPPAVRWKRSAAKHAALSWQHTRLDPGDEVAAAAIRWITSGENGFYTFSLTTARDDDPNLGKVSFPDCLATRINKRWCIVPGWHIDALGTFLLVQATIDNILSAKS
jgi:hypothetical protein